MNAARHDASTIAIACHVRHAIDSNFCDKRQECMHLIYNNNTNKSYAYISFVTFARESIKMGICLHPVKPQISRIYHREERDIRDERRERISFNYLSPIVCHKTACVVRDTRFAVQNPKLSASVIIQKAKGIGHGRYSAQKNREHRKLSRHQCLRIETSRGLRARRYILSDVVTPWPPHHASSYPV